MNSEKRTIICGEKTISYTLTRKKVKNINLRLDDDGAPKVSAPLRATISDIEKFICSKTTWIEKNRLLLNNNTIKDIKQGSVVKIWGQDYLVDISHGKSSKNALEDGRLKLYTQSTVSQEEVKQSLYDFMRAQAVKIFPQGISYWCNTLSHSPAPSLTLRFMKSRWGSCRPSRNHITLNINLVHYPLECLKMVALHEVLHFKYIHHDKKFYEAMTRHLPDWPQYKKELKSLPVSR